MSNKFVELKNLKKIYPNGFQAIFNLDLEIQKGEFVVLVGPSGCGKSTTIRMIAGLENVSNGEIIFNGRNTTDLPTRKRNISMVFQNYALFPHLTVKENIAFTLKTKRVPREVVEQKVKWAAQVLQLSYLLNRKPAQLSGGQRQRVALGRAIVAEPQLFLMDEPLSNLDAKLRGVMRTTIRKLHDDLKTTSIYVTHDQIEAMTMADKIVVMSDGFVQQVGSPEEVFENPSNIFVASFIGSPSINLIKGEYKQGKFISKYGLLKIDKPLIRKSKTNKTILGFRPQYVSAFKKQQPNSFKFNVDFVEVLGADTIVHLNDGIKYIERTENKPKTNDIIYLKISQKKLIIFDVDGGLSLTNKINKSTMNSLNIFYKSQKLIDERHILMEKHKNKKNNATLSQKIIAKLRDYIFPEYVLINKILSALKKEKRDLKSNLADYKRRKDSNNYLKTKKLIRDVSIQIKTKTNSLKNNYQNILLFNKLFAKHEKIHKSKKAINLNKMLFNKMDQNYNLGKKIKQEFLINFEYNVYDINSFNQNAKKIFNRKNKKLF